MHLEGSADNEKDLEQASENFDEDQKFTSSKNSEFMQNKSSESKVNESAISKNKELSEIEGEFIFQIF
jgi:hypothetical protein